MSGSNLVALVNQIKNLVFGRNKLLHQALNLHFLVFVFKQLQLLVVVEQVVHLAAVDLIHSDRDCEVSLVALPVIYASRKQVLNGKLLKP